MPTATRRNRVLGRIGRSRSERPAPRGPRPEIEVLARANRTGVDVYWNEHTVKAETYATAEASEAQLQWRFDQYPLFREFSRLWDRPAGEIVLDYGCGPGNDLAGFALYSQVGSIVGIDVSRKALELAADRLALHRIDPSRVRLIQTSDAGLRIPLDDCSVDYVQSQGVLMITTNPEGHVAELHRVLKPGGEACFMVYNRDSLWYHLCTAYLRRIIERRWPGLTTDEAFARDTDGEECPISRAYRPHDFRAICESAGFETDYVGGYLSLHELRVMKEHWASAIADPRLEGEHRNFLRSLTFDPWDRPMQGGFHAGIGGTFWLRKPKA
jgi:SAM-dependent methyltransferase